MNIGIRWVRAFSANWNHWDWNSEEMSCKRATLETIPSWLGRRAWIPATLRRDVAAEARLEGRCRQRQRQHQPAGRQETFDALYFKSGYFNDASLLRPQNIIDVHPNAGLKFTRTALEADGGADVFWRYSRNDAVYGVPGNVAIPALKTASSYVGTALDVNLTWQIQRHVTFQASYVHFFTGSYIHQAGGRDVDYVSTTLDFLF